MSTGLRRWLVALGIVSLVLHAAYVSTVLEKSSLTGEKIWESGDTGTYLGYAEALLRGDSPNPVYRERFLLPLILALIQKAGGAPESVLWLVVVLEPITVFCLGWIAWRLFRDQRVAVVSALIYVCYPNSYGRGGLVDTDMLHAQLAVVAVAVTLGWWQDGKTRQLAGAIGLWILLQLLRPTMYLAAAPLAVLAIDAIRRRRTWVPAVALLASLAIVPAVMMYHNWHHYRVAAPSLLQAENLWVWVLPRIRTQQRNLVEPAPISVLFAEEQARARTSPVWRQYQGLDGDRASVGPAYHQLMAESREFLGTNRAWFIKTCWIELQRQVAAPAVLYLHDVMGTKLHAAQTVMDRLHRVVLFLLPIGIAFSIRRCAPAWLLFMFVLAAMIMGPATIVAWWQGSKYRLLVDVLIIPWIALAALQPLSWAMFFVMLLFAYAPRKWMGASAAWFNVAASLVCAAGAVLAVRSRTVDGRKE